MNKIYAITGGIGSGKSLVIQYLKSKGYITYGADEIYDTLLNDDNFVYGIYKLLEIPYKTGEKFDRELVSKIVFNDKEKLKVLNAFTHEKIMSKMILLSKTHNGIVFNEVPLLFESGYENLYDDVIVIVRDKTKRINAVIKRDGKSKHQVENIIKNQFDYDKISQKKHILIVNDGDIKSLYNKVDEILSEIENNN